MPGAGLIIVSPSSRHDASPHALGAIIALRPTGGNAAPPDAAKLL